MNSLDLYLAGFGEIKTASAAPSPADAYFDALGLTAAPAQKSAAPANPAFDAYLEGFGKEAGLLDETPGQIAGNAWHGLTGMLGQGASATGQAIQRGTANLGAGVVDLGNRAAGVGDTLGNSALAVPRAIAAGANSLTGGGTLRQIGQSALHAGVDPVASSAAQITAPMVPYSPPVNVTGSLPAASATPPATFPAPAAAFAAPAAPAPAPAAGPQVSVNGSPMPKPVGPQVSVNGSPAPKPVPPPAPAAPAAAANVAGAPGPQWLDHFKKQTGSTFNPHSVVDRMKMMSFQHGMNGTQADQAAATTRPKNWNAGTSIQNTTA